MPAESWGGREGRLSRGTGMGCACGQDGHHPSHPLQVAAPSATRRPPCFCRSSGARVPSKPPPPAKQSPEPAGAAIHPPPGHSGSHGRHRRRGGDNAADTQQLCKHRSVLPTSQQKPRHSQSRAKTAAARLWVVRFRLAISKVSLTSHLVPPGSHCLAWKP